MLRPEVADPYLHRISVGTGTTGSRYPGRGGEGEAEKGDQATAVYRCSFGFLERSRRAHPLSPVAP